MVLGIRHGCAGSALHDTSRALLPTIRTHHDVRDRGVGTSLRTPLALMSAFLSSLRVCAKRMAVFDSSNVEVLRLMRRVDMAHEDGKAKILALT